MQAIYSYYDFNKSIERVTETLDSSEALYVDKTSIPPRELLTFNNGFYVKCSALFVDIRKSKDLPNNHTRPVLAKIYKTYISEVVAVMRGNSDIFEISIEGDCVWGVFDTPYKSNIDNVFSTAAEISSLLDILNVKYKKKGYSEIAIGIGASWGESLYIKSGYKGSGINEVVWVGELVGEAAKLCSYGNRQFDDAEIMVSSVFYSNLKDSNKKLLAKSSYSDCYEGNVINTTMNEWVKNNG